MIEIKENIKNEREEKGMKMKRLARVFTSAVLVGAMVATMGGMTAFAANENIPLTKQITTDGKTLAPDAAFTFTIAVAEGETLTKGIEVDAEAEGKTGISQSIVVKQGLPGGLTFGANGTTASIEFKSSDNLSTDGYTKATTDNLQANDNVFTDTPSPVGGAGVYHYTITESGEYEGVKNDTNPVRDVYVFVAYENNNLAVRSVIIAKKDANGAVIKQNELKFVNTYGDNTETSTTKTLEVGKTVTGNQGEKGRDFFFDITVTSNTNDKKFNYEIINTNTNPETLVDKTSTMPSVLTANQMASNIPLKHGYVIRVYGLTKTDNFIAFENNYASDGYTQTITGFGKQDTGVTEGVQQIGETGGIGEENGKVKSVMVTNHKEVTTPTGIVLSFAPYILLVAFAGVFGVLFLRRRKEEF